MYDVDVPVALFLFNRPQLTARVFARIAQIRPRLLFLIADGPGDEAQQSQVDAARAVVSRVDWDCEVLRDFSDINLGCRARISSGIDWVFTHVDQAILLEDDCLPDPTFFPYCAQLLDRYRNEDRVMMIGGCNFQNGRRRTSYSYYFSWITHIWGWATWRRAWRYYDVTMRRWPALRDTDWLEAMLGEPVARRYRRQFDDTWSGKLQTWDYQWAFANWQRGALTVLPEANLVSNIGFGPEATHTKDPQSRDAGVPTQPIPFPLRHPPEIERCIEADDFTFENSFRIKLRPAGAAA